MIKIDELITKIQLSYPNLKIEFKLDNSFKEVKIIGDNKTLILYPNDGAYFVNLYSTQNSYEEYVLNEIKEIFTKE